MFSYYQGETSNSCLDLTDSFSDEGSMQGVYDLIGRNNEVGVQAIKEEKKPPTNAKRSEACKNRGGAEESSTTAGHRLSGVSVSSSTDEAGRNLDDVEVHRKRESPTRSMDDAPTFHRGGVGVSSSTETGNYLASSKRKYERDDHQFDRNLPPAFPRHSVDDAPTSRRDFVGVSSTEPGHHFPHSWPEYGRGTCHCHCLPYRGERPLRMCIHAQRLW